MNAQNEELRLYFARVRPLYHELFSMAHAICGNYERAEYALSSAILAGWNNRRHFRSARGFRESMRADMRRIAVSQIDPGAEITWEPRASADADSVPRLAQLQETPAILRTVMLRYGCGLSVKEISRAMEQPRRQTEQTLRRFMRRFRRRLGDSAAKPEALIQDMCREELADGAEAPDMGAIFRTFEAEASQSYRPGTRLAGRIASCVAYVLLILMLASAIWFASAVMRPARVSDDGLLTETLNEQ
jgi:DNA-directed RNA polymerase specialized sigma24 family protein